MKNIFPIDTVSLANKENLLEQHSIVIWLVGLSGSGKSTIATELENTLHNAGYLTQLLDGDNLRHGINNNLSFTEEDRIENIRRTAEVAKLFANCGVVTICSFISPTEEIRNNAKAIIGDRYFEVFVNCPIEVCELRDVKGLYKKARAGEIKNFTGIDSPFEEPTSPDLEINTATQTLDECYQILYDTIKKKIYHLV